MSFACFTDKIISLDSGHLCFFFKTINFCVICGKNIALRSLEFTTIVTKFFDLIKDY